MMKPLPRHVLGAGRTGPSGFLNDVTFKQVAYPRTARIIGDGQVYIKNERPAQYAAWKEVDEITAASFYLKGDSINIQA